MSAPGARSSAQEAAKPSGRLRWTILALLFAATTINYLDRIVFSVLIPVIRKDLNIGDQEYGYLNACFQITYTLGFLAMGKFIDRFGTKIGYGVSIAWWSLAAGLHAFAQTPVQLGLWRAFLGLGESGNFPAAIKSVSEWFPIRDRAFATGIFNAGTNVASMVGPPLFVAMAASFGWRASFVITAASGFVWLALWMVLYHRPEQHPHISRAELAYINSDPASKESQPAIGWAEALRFRETWGFAAGKFFSDPVWWFYLYWLPPYLFDVRKFNLNQIGWALPFIYLLADFGSVGGGWISGVLIRRGWQHGRARRLTMLVCALTMPVAATAVLAPNPVIAILLVSLATSAHQAWSANLYTTVSDVFPRQAVASVTGIGGFVGGFGGVLFSALVPGYVVPRFGYTPVFLTMGLFHLTGWLILRRLMGDMNPIRASRS